MKRLSSIVVGVSLVVGVSPASAQSLYEVNRSQDDSIRGTARSAEVGPPVSPTAGVALHEVSLFAITPPEPRDFEENDLVTVIISERSQVDRSQTLETDKRFRLDGELSNFLDLSQLIEGRFVVDDGANLPEVGLDLRNRLDAEGDYEREDTFTDRITARVAEVKPNGTLLLEARRMIKTDEEESQAVLSGICRQEDITTNNTVQSNQLFDLSLLVENEGEIRKTAKPGLIKKAMDLLFNF